MMILSPWGSNPLSVFCVFTQKRYLHHLNADFPPIKSIQDFPLNKIASVQTVFSRFCSLLVIICSLYIFIPNSFLIYTWHTRCKTQSEETCSIQVRLARRVNWGFPLSTIDPVRAPPSPKVREMFLFRFCLRFYN